MPPVQLAETDQDLLKCWPVLKLLRPQLNASDYLPLLRSMLLEGYAGVLLDYVIHWAEEQGYQCVTLDSGPHRHAAHRLYLNKGFQLSSYHFLRRNADGQPHL